MAGRPEDRLRDEIDALRLKTGRAMADWVAIVEESKLPDRKRIVAMLRAGYGLSHGLANLVANKALEGKE
jgi:hypothetical protein